MVEQRRGMRRKRSFATVRSGGLVGRGQAMRWNAPLCQLYGTGTSRASSRQRGQRSRGMEERKLDHDKE